MWYGLVWFIFILCVTEWEKDEQYIARSAEGKKISSNIMLFQKTSCRHLIGVPRLKEAHHAFKEYSESPAIER